MIRDDSGSVYATCEGCGRRIILVRLVSRDVWFHVLGAWKTGEHWDGHDAVPQKAEDARGAVTWTESELRAVWGDR